MNAQMLKELYKRISGEYHQADCGWYEDYISITSAVNEWRNAHSTGLLSATDDKSLLQRMLYDDSNGVSDYGQSTLGKETFNGLIQYARFIQAATTFVRESTHENFLELQESMREYIVDVAQKKRMPWLRVYRFASACDLKLTTVVNEGSFNTVFWGLIGSGLLDRPADEICNGDWYEKNRWLTEQLTTAIPDNHSDVESEKVDCYWRNMFVWFLWERYFNTAFQNKPQIVRYGPPGTGKTYVARRDMKFMFTAWKISNDIPATEEFENHFLQLQFHPSFGYEDFLEGLRPVEVFEKDDQDNPLPKTRRIELRITNGGFKEFCKTAGRWEIDLVKEKIYPDGNPEKSYLTRKVSELDSNTEAKNKLLSKGDYWRMVFNTPNKEKTLEEVLPPYFVLIDEINRAELSRTFGELMFCLEYRGVRGAVSTQYAELNTEKEAMIFLGGKAKFFVPTNVRIIGTMNTIDRSVESFDFALRRRFGWKFVGPEESVLSNNLAETMRWLGDGDRRRLINGWKELNMVIKDDPLLGRDYQIGHAYLMGLKYTPESLGRSLSKLREAIWEDAISPLLEEYLRGTYDRDNVKESDPLNKFREAFERG